MLASDANHMPHGATPHAIDILGVIGATVAFIIALYLSFASTNGRRWRIVGVYYVLGVVLLILTGEVYLLEVAPIGLVGVLRAVAFVMVIGAELVSLYYIITVGEAEGPREIGSGMATASKTYLEHDDTSDNR